MDRQTKHRPELLGEGTFGKVYGTGKIAQKEVIINHYRDINDQVALTEIFASFRVKSDFISSALNFKLTCDRYYLVFNREFDNLVHIISSDYDRKVRPYTWDISVGLFKTREQLREFGACTQLLQVAVRLERLLERRSAGALGDLLRDLVDVLERQVEHAPDVANDRA